jgi:PAS domain S-box-containing protein
MARLRSPVRTGRSSAIQPTGPNYQRLFERVPASCMVLDADLVILALNDAMLRDTMSERADVVGHPLFEIFPTNPDDTEATGARAIRESLEQVRRTLLADSVPVHRYDLPGPDGGYVTRYWSTVIEPVIGSGGEPLAIILMTQNVTEYVQFREQYKAMGDIRAQQMAAEILLRSAEAGETSQEVRLSAARIERFLEATPDAMLGIDASGIIQVVNKQAEEVFGYDREELIGQPVEILIPGSVRGRHVGHRVAYLQRPEIRQMAADLEPKARRKDGSLFPISVSLATVEDKDGQLVIAAVRDVTELTAATSAARRLAAIVEHADDAIFDTSVGGLIASWNKGAERLFGYDEADVVGKSATVLALPGQEDEEHRLIKQAVSSGEVTRTEAVRTRKDGSQVDVSLTLSPVHDRKGKVTGLSAIARDITERKLADAALAERTRELEISNRDLLQFASVASHDLQEPLRKVASFCQLLARRYQGQLDEEADEYIGFVVDGAVRMQALINDLLSLARVGRSGDQMVEVNCGKVMRQVLGDMTLVLEEAGAELVVADDLPVVYGHPGLIAQLFTNLIGNAVKFHGPRPPRVEVSAALQDDEWRFAVADNGIGIEAQYADRVFDVFERLHTRSEYPGTGIGLALCRKIVELHRGRIWLESQPGEGTTFYFTLPTGGQQP